MRRGKLDTLSIVRTEDAQRPSLQRARGAACVALDGAVGEPKLRDLAQSGCAKVFLPRVSGPPEIVFLNTAGGLTGGDRLHYALHVGPSLRATATTQTAERAYASTGQPAQADVTLMVGTDATVDWLPQETILFEDSNLTRRTQIALAGTARVTFCESLVLGRAAMGETVTRARLFDRRTVTRDGAPVLTDAVALDPSAYDTGPAGLNGARAFAVLAIVAPGAEDAAAPLSHALAACADVEAGVSGWDGRTVARLRAADGWPLRRALAVALMQVRQAALPRVWQI